MAEPVVRRSTEADLGQVIRILNHYIAVSHVTFETNPQTLQDRLDWFSGFSESGPHRLLVADEEGRVRGWAASTPHRPKPAYDRSVETTVYVAPEHVGRGIGRLLAGSLVESLLGEDVHRAFAVIALPNPASVSLHLRLGYRRVGVLSEAGFKFGRYWDVAWYELDL